jgi:hypothetical protein
VPGTGSPSPTAPGAMPRPNDSSHLRHRVGPRPCPQLQ